MGHHPHPGSTRSSRGHEAASAAYGLRQTTSPHQPTIELPTCLGGTPWHNPMIRLTYDVVRRARDDLHAGVLIALPAGHAVGTAWPAAPVVSDP